MANQLGISETIFLAVTRFAEKEVSFRLLVHQGQGGQDIGYYTDQDHLDAAKSLGKTTQDVEHQQAMSSDQLPVVSTLDKQSTFRGKAQNTKPAWK